MNKIEKRPLSHLGLDFLKASSPDETPNIKNDLHLRDNTWVDKGPYRVLTSSEIEILIKNDNHADRWDHIFVGKGFNALQVKNSHFYGVCRLGRMDAVYLEFHDYQQAVGIYNSTVISCDIGDNVVIKNVQYLAHYQIENEVILVNVGEMSNTAHAKFGNGIVKEGEEENTRIWLEICNENGGRKVAPFDSMLPADAYLWSQSRQDSEYQNALLQMTQKEFAESKGQYGRVGTRTVVKNCAILKDVTIGTDAYLKGANKIKNVTIHSSAEADTQIGEGCEIVNGIVGYGCRIFYGVKAVRFVLASHSTLKYGARLINSYLGHNSTISCCEVLNSLIFGAHEQHHNDSFLCAALVGGQSNIAAGATIGSNHNSRSPDGEMRAGRGLWAGLSVSLKHNSKFASFTLISKGTYVYELNQTLPFALVLNNEHDDSLSIMPAYWFMHNMYALARNAHKYAARDNRTEKIQSLEYNYLAPDTIDEIVQAMAFLEKSVAGVWLEKHADRTQELYSKTLGQKGRDLLLDSTPLDFEVVGQGLENSKRKVHILKPQKAYSIYRKLVELYFVEQLLLAEKSGAFTSLSDLQMILNHKNQNELSGAWTNVGGQLMLTSDVNELKSKIKNQEIQTWNDVHEFYTQINQKAPQDYFLHALSAWMHVFEFHQLHASDIHKAMNEALLTREWLTQEILASREKDYTSPFRKMLYENDEEMNAVLGAMDQNPFILQTQKELAEFKEAVTQALNRIN